jgi:orotate phosphoribosyltransferase
LAKYIKFLSGRENLSIEKSRENAKTEICRILNKIGALKFGTFRLTSGRISPYYIDLRIVPSFPDAFHKICDFYVDFIKEEVGAEKFDRVAGIPVAGIPFASTIAYHLKKPFLYIRKGVRLHGRQRRVEGVIAPGDRVLLVDDLITTGLSLKKAAKAITVEGGVVSDAVVLLDRDEGGKERLEKSGIRLHAMIRVSEIANKLHEMGAIDEEQLKTILKQIKKG